MPLLILLGALLQNTLLDHMLTAKARLLNVGEMHMFCYYVQFSGFFTLILIYFMLICIFIFCNLFYLYTLIP